MYMLPMLKKYVSKCRKILHVHLHNPYMFVKFTKSSKNTSKDHEIKKKIEQTHNAHLTCLNIFNIQFFNSLQNKKGKTLIEKKKLNYETPNSNQECVQFRARNV
jgi:hypothetical protein